MTSIEELRRRIARLESELASLEEAGIAPLEQNQIAAEIVTARRQFAAALNAQTK